MLSRMLLQSPLVPIPSGADQEPSLPHSNQTLQQEQSSDDLDNHDFDWSVDDEDVAYFSNLLDD